MQICSKCGSEAIYCHTQSPTMLYVCGNCGYAEPVSHYRRMPVDFEDDFSWVDHELGRP